MWANAIVQPPDIPALFAHQERDAARYVNEQHIFNQSDPGTGKTRTIIEAIARIKPRRTLILAPKSILHASWQTDFEKFAPDITTAIASAEKREKAFKASSDVVVMNHDGVNWLAKNPKYVDGFDFLVIDESTAFKTPNSDRSKAALKVRDLIELKSPYAKFSCMSGTPTPNGILDIFHQQLLVDGGQRLGDKYYKFRAAVCSPVIRGAFTEWTEKDGIADAVAGLIGDCVIRNRLEDCIDIPANRTVTVEFELNPKQRRLYDTLRKQALLDLETGTVSAVNAGVLEQKLLQVASGAVYDEDHITQVLDTDRVELVIELVKQRQHSVVAFNWKHQRDQLINFAQKLGISYEVIDGSVNLNRRGEIVKKFEKGQLQVVFANPQSTSHGLTLVKGQATIWASPCRTSNAEHYTQFNARIHRAGQTQATETIHVCAKNTLDEKVYNRLASKTNNVRDFISLFA